MIEVWALSLKSYWKMLVTYVDLGAPTSWDTWGSQSVPFDSVLNQLFSVTPLAVDCSQVSFDVFPPGHPQSSSLSLTRGTQCDTCFTGLEDRILQIWSSKFNHHLHMTEETGGSPVFLLTSSFSTKSFHLIMRILQRHFDSKAIGCFSCLTVRCQDLHWKSSVERMLDL